MKNNVPFSTTKNNMENKRPVQQQQQQQLQHRVVAPLPTSSLQPQQHRPTTEEEEKAKREKARARGMAFLKVGTSSKPSMKTKSAAAARLNAPAPQVKHPQQQQQNKTTVEKMQALAKAMEVASGKIPSSLAPVQPAPSTQLCAPGPTPASAWATVLWQRTSLRAPTAKWSLPWATATTPVKRTESLSA